MTSDSPKQKKFFFDLHNFDDDFEDNELDIDLVDPQEEEEPEEELPPLPPMFSEEQVAEAEKKAFERGLAQGEDNIRNAQAQTVANAINALVPEIKTLHERQIAQSLTYGDESVELAISIFEKLFPHFKKAHGFDEMKAQILAVIEKQRSQSEIIISAPKDLKKDLEKHIKDLQATVPDVTLRIEHDETLNGEVCTMKWHGGGAEIDRDTLAENILSLLKEMVAGKLGKGHDKNEIEKTGTVHASNKAEDASATSAPDEIKD